MSNSLSERAARSIAALRSPDASLQRVPNTVRQSIADVIEQLLIPVPAQAAPVAWRYRHPGDRWSVSDTEPEDVEPRRLEVQPLYAAQPPAAPVETKRKTFTIPPGHEAVRDSEGRATGEVRPRLSAATGDETCYIERSKVRDILIGSNVNNEDTKELLQEVDALPIFNAADFNVSPQAMRETFVDRVKRDFPEFVEDLGRPELPLEMWTTWARRDDWHERFVGSDIRQMLGEIQRLREHFDNLPAQPQGARKS